MHITIPEFSYDLLGVEDHDEVEDSESSSHHHSSSEESGVSTSKFPLVKSFDFEEEPPMAWDAPIKKVNTQLNAIMGDTTFDDLPATKLVLILTLKKKLIDTLVEAKMPREAKTLLAQLVDLRESSLEKLKKIRGTEKLSNSAYWHMELLFNDIKVMLGVFHSVGFQERMETLSSTNDFGEVLDCCESSLEELKSSESEENEDLIVQFHMSAIRCCFTAIECYLSVYPGFAKSFFSEAQKHAEALPESLGEVVGITLDLLHARNEGNSYKLTGFDTAWALSEKSVEEVKEKFDADVRLQPLWPFFLVSIYVWQFNQQFVNSTFGTQLRHEFPEYGFLNQMMFSVSVFGHMENGDALLPLCSGLLSVYAKQGLKALYCLVGLISMDEFQVEEQIKQELMSMVLEMDEDDIGERTKLFAHYFHMASVYKQTVAYSDEMKEDYEWCMDLTMRIGDYQKNFNNWLLHAVALKTKDIHEADEAFDEMVEVFLDNESPHKLLVAIGMSMLVKAECCKDFGDIEALFTLGDESVSKTKYVSSSGAQYLDCKRKAIETYNNSDWVPQLQVQVQELLDAAPKYLKTTTELLTIMANVKRSQDDPSWKEDMIGTWDALVSNKRWGQLSMQSITIACKAEEDVEIRKTACRYASLAMDVSKNTTYRSMLCLAMSRIAAEQGDHKQNLDCLMARVRWTCGYKGTLTNCTEALSSALSIIMNSSLPVTDEIKQTLDASVESVCEQTESSLDLALQQCYLGFNAIKSGDREYATECMDVAVMLAEEFPYSGNEEAFYFLWVLASVMKHEAMMTMFLEKRRQQAIAVNMVGEMGFNEIELAELKDRNDKLMEQAERLKDLYNNHLNSLRIPMQIRLLALMEKVFLAEENYSEMQQVANTRAVLQNAQGGQQQQSQQSQQSQEAAIIGQMLMVLGQSDDETVMAVIQSICNQRDLSNAQDWVDFKNTLLQQAPSEDVAMLDDRLNRAWAAIYPNPHLGE